MLGETGSTAFKLKCFRLMPMRKVCALTHGHKLRGRVAEKPLAKSSSCSLLLLDVGTTTSAAAQLAGAAATI